MGGAYAFVVDARDRDGGPRAEFRILGPLEVDVGGRPVTVGKRERALLALLLLSADRVVSADRLVDDLWDGDPPDAAPRVLRVYVHRLRKALADAGERVETRPPGYRVRLEDGALDAVRFEELVGRARSQAAAGDYRSAAGTLRRALGLWRGPVLADLADARFVAVEAARLEAARLVALEDRIDFDLASGRHHDVLPELEGLTAEHRLRERFWGQRMLALYRSGRQTESLRVYQEARRHLVEELGLEPGPALVELETAILRQDNGLLPPTALEAAGVSMAAVPLPPELAVGAALPFVSRQAELEEAEALVFDPDRRRLAVIWLLGEPGIGKTRLAREIARRAHGREATVLFGWNSEDLAVPYQPVIEALRWFVAHVADDDLAASLGGLPGDLVRLAPELGERLGGAGPSRSPSPEVEQYQLFEAVRSWWAAAGPSPTVIVLDDLQWAGRPTLSLLGHAARHAGPSRAVLVCTARTTSPDSNEALAALAEDLDRRGVPSRRFVLGGLGVDAVGDLVASAAGRPLDGPLTDLAVRLRAETAGNPLFLDGLLAGLADGQASPDVLTGSLAETVARRLARLPDEVGELLRVAAIAGLDFDLAVVAAGARRSEPDALDALDGAAGAGLLEEAGPDRFRFAHALVRAVLRQQLSLSRRVRIHLRVGEALESLHSDDLDAHAAELAHHFRAALPAASADKARAYSLLAAERATRLLSHHEAADAYRLALDLVDAAGPEGADQRIELGLRLAQAEFRAGHFAAARQTLRSTEGSALTAGTAEQLARIAVAFDEASVHIGFGGTDSLPLLERAAAALPADDTPLRALVLAASARALMFDGRRSESLERGNQALAIARRLGDRATTARVLMRTIYSYKGVHHPLELLDQTVELTGLACELGDEELYLFGSFGLDEAAAVLGAVPLWDAILAEQHRLVAIIRQPYLEHDLCLRVQLRASVGGDLAQAEDWLRRAQAIGEELGWGLEGLYSFVTFLLRREQGRLAGLGPAVRRVAAESNGVWAPGLAALCVETGDLDTARTLFDRLAAREFSGVPRDGTRPVCVGLLAEVCVALGDAERAQWLQAELLAAEGRLLVLTGMAACLGPVDRLLGALASLSGDRTSATGWYEQALTLARNVRSPLWTAYCLRDLAEHNRAEDPSASMALLDEAAELSERHGLVRAGDRVAVTRRSFIHPA
jgi:DNA-binding SARP family transcriptional activator